MGVRECGLKGAGGCFTFVELITCVLERFEAGLSRLPHCSSERARNLRRARFAGKLKYLIFEGVTSIRDAVRAGLGVAVLPDWLIQEDLLA